MKLIWRSVFQVASLSNGSNCTGAPKKFPFKRNQYLHFDLGANISEPVVDMSETTVAAEGLPPLGPSGPPPRKCQPRRGIPRAARCSSASLASGHGRRIPEQRRNTHLPRLCKPLVRHCLGTGNRDYCSQNKGASATIFCLDTVQRSTALTLCEIACLFLACWSW